MSLPQISKEQEYILNELSLGNNVWVNAVAGSGKTTTILYIFKRFSDKKILVLTYNKRLKFETRLRSIGIKTQSEIHTYHSYGYKYYSSNCTNDSGMSEIINVYTPTKFPLIKFDIIVIDEIQDMTRLYYKFIKHIIRDNLSPDYQFLLLGDPKQSIYGYNNADSRYLTLAEHIFINKHPWSKCILSTSFRLTKQMSNFINNVIFIGDDSNSQKINTIKSGNVNATVDYYVLNIFNKKSLGGIISIIKQYSPEDIFILAPSIKKAGKKSPVINLANLLSNDGIKLYIPNQDNEELNEKYIKGKLVISTYHQAKGLERKIVIVLSFDESYYMYYDRGNKTQTILSNPIYVAITRASEKLILIQSHSKNLIPCIKSYSLLTKYANIIIVNKPYYTPKTLKKCMFESKDNKTNITQTEDEYMYGCVIKSSNKSLSPDIAKLTKSVTDLISYKNIDILDKALSLIKYKDITIRNQMYEVIDIKCVIDNEFVGDINGKVITVLYEIYNNGTIPIDNIKKLYTEFTINKKYHSLTIDINKLNDIITTLEKYMSATTFYPKDIIYLAILGHYLDNGYVHRLNQISNNYDWMKSDDLSMVYNRLDKLIYSLSNNKLSININEIKRNKLVFEKFTGAELYNGVNIKGYVDIIDDQKKIVYEIKYKSKLQDEDYLQLYIYAILLQNDDEKYKSYRYILFNIKNNDSIELFPVYNTGIEIISLLLNNNISIEDNITFINNLVSYQPNQYRKSNLPKLCDIYDFMK